LVGGTSIPDNSAVTVASGATLTLAGGGEMIGSLAGEGQVVLSYNLTAGNDNSNTEFSGVISSTNNSGIAKMGSGTLTLSGVNTYTGSTIANGGTLLVSGALNGTNGISVTSGAILGGTGSLFANNSTNGLTVASGGTLSPGMGTGTGL